MRHIGLALALAVAALPATPLAAQQNRTSPHETISTVLGDRRTGNRITIVYGRPYTRDPKSGEPRHIWGGLVPWGDAYRLGADEATLLVTQQPLVVGETPVPAGAYTLYLVPSETGATRLALSTAIGRWGVPVDVSHDLARVDMKRESLSKPVDQLTIALDKDSAGGGVLRILWETTQFSVPLKVAAPRVEFPQASPSATLRQRVGLTDIVVDYSRPSARGRVMLGGNNPFGEVWRTGANSATRISFSTPVTLQGTPIAAGTYELFTIPGMDAWTVILQKPANQWGAYAYDPRNDVARVTAKPEKLASPVETFVINLADIRADSATLELVWERTRVPLRLGVDVVGVMVPRIDAAMAGPGRKPYAQAALFYLDNGLDLNKAKAWMDAAIAAQPDGFSLYYHKARILAKLGDVEGARAAARTSLGLVARTTGPEKGEYTRLNEALIAGLK